MSTWLRLRSCGWKTDGAATDGRAEVQQEQRSEWQFLITEGEQWLWEVKHSDGTIEQGKKCFPTLKDCVDDARRHGWGTWKTEERREVEPGRDALDAAEKQSDKSRRS